MRAFLLLVLGVVAANAALSNPSRIVGGSEVDIGQYPYAVAMLYSSSGSTNFDQYCGGSIINNRSILSAAHCFDRNLAAQWRARVGSSSSSSGGVVHSVSSMHLHPNFISTLRYLNNDIAIIRVTSPFSYNDKVRPGPISGVDYYVRENEDVWAIGWGRTSAGDPHSELLRHVQVKVVNYAYCRSRYASIRDININMICSGLLNVGGHDQCHGDAGGALVHNGVIVGVCSWTLSCGNAQLPGVNTRVSSYVSWIQNNA